MFAKMMRFTHGVRNENMNAERLRT
jgi:hypothetical protein